MSVYAVGGWNVAVGVPLKGMSQHQVVQALFGREVVVHVLPERDELRSAALAPPEPAVGLHFVERCPQDRDVCVLELLELGGRRSRAWT